MMSHAPVGIGKLDLNGKILDQPGHRKMLGYSQSELLHRTAAELNHPEDWLRSAACYEELKRGERTASPGEALPAPGRSGAVGRVTVTLVRDDQLQPTT